MSLPITADAYRDLLLDDLDWLKQQPRSLERDHIVLVLQRELRDADRICRQEFEAHIRSERKP